MRKLWFNLGMLSGLVASAPAWAATDLARSYHLQTAASWMSQQGGDLSLGVQAQPWAGVSVGPRIGVLMTDASSASRVDAVAGGEGTLWFFNAFGPGGGVDWVVPREAARLETFFALRLKRVKDEGALAARIGASYDSQLKSSFKLGIAFQLGGVR